MTPNVMLYVALFLYACGTLVALATLFTRDKRTQQVALGVMIAGFVSHTIWIGSICVRTHHPPLTNLPEASSFVAWTLFLVELIIFIRYRVHAAAFFLYPLVLMLLTVTAVVREPFAQMRHRRGEQSLQRTGSRERLDDGGRIRFLVREKKFAP